MISGLPGTGLELYLGLLSALILGGYLYTFYTSRDLSQEISRLWERLTNHLEHRVSDIESRLRRLEKQSSDD